MAKKKSPVHFDRPRDEEGHFLPMELWTRKEIRTFDRLKREGLLENPIKRTKISGKKRAKDLYIQPQGDGGKFLPKSEWSSSEKRLAKRAEEEGLTIAQQLPRNTKGQFVSPTGKKPKKKVKKAPVASAVGGVEYPVAVHPGAVYPGDSSSMHQGNVTVVYPPYPPPAPPASVQAPQVQFIPMPMQHTMEQMPVTRRKRLLPEQIESDEEELQESASRQLELFGSDDTRIVDRGSREKGIPRVLVAGRNLYEQDFDTGALTLCQSLDQISGEVSREHEITRKRLGDQFTEQCKPCFAPELEIDSLKENPRDRHPMYYVKRTFGGKAGNALGFLRDNPLVALVAVGALFAVGYALYRAFKAYRYRMFASLGVEIVNGTLYFPGEEPYQVTDSDKLWLARSIWGEVSRTPSAWSRPDVKQGGTAVMWSYANHYMTVGRKRSLYPTLGGFVQAYSQPINPRWDDSSDARCQSSPQMCTPDRLAFRQRLRTTPWEQFPAELQNLVLAFAAGQVPNSIGTRTDFRAAGTGFAPADPVNVAGNVFGTAPNARRRPTEQVA